MLFFHGGGYIFGHIDLFRRPVSRDMSASGVWILSVANSKHLAPPSTRPTSEAETA